MTYAPLRRITVIPTVPPAVSSWVTTSKYLLPPAVTMNSLPLVVGARASARPRSRPQKEVTSPSASCWLCAPMLPS